MPKSRRTLPTPEQAREGVRPSADNASDLLVAAKTLGVAGLYGPASSLLVLALEEAQKARVLVALATKNDDAGLSPDEVNDIIYRDHGVRHHAAWTAAVSPTTTAKHVMPPRRETPLQRKQYHADMAALGWHMKANSLKKRGLYVDYIKDEWHGPREITSAEFGEGLVIVERFVQITTRQADNMSSSADDD
jgi:AbiV family abortive infection protein